MAQRIVKKYGNRRLYDTGESRYITLDELAEMVRGGAEIRVVDAKSGADLTQSTLTQIITDERDLAKLLPVPLLHQLIRLGDDALAEFFGQYVTGALQMYMQARRGVQAVAPYNPFAQLPFAATDALTRMWMASPFGQQGQPQPPPAPTPPPPVDVDVNVHVEDEDDGVSAREEVAAMRRELEELKQAIRASTAGASDGDEPAEPQPKARRRKRG